MWPGSNLQLSWGSATTLCSLICETLLMEILPAVAEGSYDPDAGRRVQFAGHIMLAAPKAVPAPQAETIRKEQARQREACRKAKTETLKNTGRAHRKKFKALVGAFFDDLARALNDDGKKKPGRVIECAAC